MIGLKIERNCKLQNAIQGARGPQRHQGFSLGFFFLALEILPFVPCLNEIIFRGFPFWQASIHLVIGYPGFNGRQSQFSMAPFLILVTALAAICKDWDISAREDFPCLFNYVAWGAS